MEPIDTGLPDLVDVETNETLKPGADGTYKVLLEKSRQRIFCSEKKSNRLAIRRRPIKFTP